MILTEFFDSNTHRCYPFANNNDLPTDLLVDAQFIVTGNVPKNGVYISKVVAAPDIIQFYISVLIDNKLIELDENLINVSTRLSPYSEQAFNLVSDKYKIIIQGSLTVGYFDTILNKTNGKENIDKLTYNLQESGEIISQRVVPISEWCTGLVINNKLYTGNISLTVGEGLELSASDDGQIIISAKGLTLPTSNVMSDEEIISEIMSRIGEGVKSINGCTGDITIGTGSYTLGRDVGNDYTDANNLQVDTQGQSIIISNSRDNPIYDANSSETLDTIVETLKRLVANAESLNARYNTLEQHNYALDNAINLFGVLLSKVD